jgi:transcriptional regulator GlxA family with amidase domain
VLDDYAPGMKRRTFLAALAAGVGLPAAGLGVARALTDGEGPLLPPRALALPEDGVIRTAFMIGPSVNVIDTAGPWEVFQDAGAGSQGSSPFELYTVAETRQPVDATAGLRLLPDYAHHQAPLPNVIVVPAHQASEAALRWLRQAAAKADVVMSVCTGAFILAGAGLLDGRRATTHHDFFSEFEASFTRVELVRGERFVEDDRMATAAGLTSGIDLALRVVERYLGRPAAEGTARYMEHESARWRTA